MFVSDVSKKRLNLSSGFNSEAFFIGFRGNFLKNMFTQLMIEASFFTHRISSKLWTLPFDCEPTHIKLSITKSRKKLLFWFFSNLILLPLDLLYGQKILLSKWEIFKTNPYNIRNATIAFLIIYLLALISMALILIINTAVQLTTYSYGVNVVYHVDHILKGKFQFLLQSV